MRWIPSREELQRSRWLAPIAHHLHDDRLWHMERGSVARAVAIGLFVGIALPVAQFLFAAAIAVWLRAHIAIAAAGTLVTNPLTFAPLYWLAHRIGQLVLGNNVDEAAAAGIEAKAQAVVEHQSWIAAAWEMVQTAGAPLIVGLGVLAVTSSVVGFTLVWLLWRPPKAEDDAASS
jgi:uncharacterized protein (DUF2062 family)